MSGRKSFSFNLKRQTSGSHRQMDSKSRDRTPPGLKPFSLKQEVTTVQLEVTAAAAAAATSQPAADVNQNNTRRPGGSNSRLPASQKNEGGEDDKKGTVSPKELKDNHHASWRSRSSTRNNKAAVVEEDNKEDGGGGLTDHKHGSNPVKNVDGDDDADYMERTRTPQLIEENTRHRGNPLQRFCIKFGNLFCCGACGCLPPREVRLRRRRSRSAASSSRTSVEAK
eukprot:CAMPEP_0170173628 /NCGR_PEP_ID=MMETSP0040_2-20121228/6912_1 /TAXON_ID=641309 /ORGANISM="Lotharella oceanica, Strain CCMP622" /LENGTH=224 /DNA_ID=CAMNT_0010414897 /DNA_START=186 /DNA_END=860 /DNA_ORIENTATION=+